MKKIKLQKIPVIVQIYPQQIHEADLMREMKVDRHNLTRELERQARRYSFWAALYSTVADKVDMLEQGLELLEAELFTHYAKRGVAKRKADLKYYVIKDPKFQMMKTRLRKWKNSERILKVSALRGFEHKLNSLMALNANRRADKKAEGYKEEE